MKTGDFYRNLTSAKLNETFEKNFGGRVNVEDYTREQLEDLRNRVRTMVFQQEATAGYNDLLTNETYQKNQAMLQLLNTRIKEMLGEDIKKLRDKMDQLSEAKKGDGNLANNAKPYDKVTRGDVIAGRLGKDEKGGKKVKEGAKADKNADKEKDRVEVGEDMEPEDLGTVAEINRLIAKGMHETDAIHAVAKKYGDNPSELASFYYQHNMHEGKHAKEAAEKTPTTWTDKSGKKHPATKVKGDKYTGKDAEKDEKVKEAEEKRAPAKKQERVATLPSGAQVKTTKVQGWQSQAADKAAKKDQGFEEGKDEGKPGKNFAKIVKGATPKYGKEVAKKIAGKVRADLADKGKLEEANRNFKHNVRFVNESLVFLLNEDEEGKAKAITAASDIVNDFTTWMQRVGQYQTKSMIELADSIKANFGAAEAEQFKQAVAASLSQTLEVLTSQREAISGAVAVLAGEATPEAPMGQEPSDMGGEVPPEEPGMDMAPPDEMNPEPAGDEFAGAEGPSSNREVRESKEQTRARKLAEAHSIISKLAR